MLAPLFPTPGTGEVDLGTRGTIMPEHENVYV